MYPELVEAKGGKAIGAFFGTPGLDLKTTCGGPIQAEHVMGDVLFAVSGSVLYRITSAFAAQAIGPVPSSGPNLYSMIDVNGMLGIIAGNSFYVHIETAVTGLSGGDIDNPGVLYDDGDTVQLTPTGGQQNSPATITVSSTADALIDGVITDGGIDYAVGDLLTLTQSGGTQVTAAIIVVTAVQAGAVVAFEPQNGGAFTVDPTSFTQASTTGSGSGFTLGSPIYTTGAITGFTVTAPGIFTSNPASFAQDQTSGNGGSFVLSNPTFVAAPQIMPIALPFSVAATAGPMSGCQCDAFGLLSQPGTNIFWQSDEGDLTLWDALNFNSATVDPDNIVALFQQHQEVFVFKEYETEVWTNAGNPGFAFAQLTDVYIETGCAAIASIAMIAETLMLVSQNTLGGGIVVQLRGYAPARISTHAIEHAIQEQGSAAISAATAFTYQQEGHDFYQLTVGNKTFVYDVTASVLAGIPMWHERAAFANGQFSRHWASCAVFCYGFVLIGDYRNGNIYAYDLDTLTDNGQTRRFVRSWRALSQPSFDPVRFSELTIDMQTGIGVPPGTTPHVMLRWSDDGGHTWSNTMLAPVGPPGATALRVRFLPLGSTRRETGLDRIFELSGTDIFPTALLGAELR